MPCLAIHLAVAKKYLEKHPEENEEEFVLGSIAADTKIQIDKYIQSIKDDKNNRHFGENYNTDNLIEYMKKKVNFSKFFETNDLSTSFLRAYFLHLVCDYYFFGDYIDDKRLQGIPLKDAIKLGYNDYNLITPIIIKKYNIKVPKEIENLINQEGIPPLRVLDEETVIKFIEEMSNIDLESEKKILVTGKNKSERIRS